MWRAFSIVSTSLVDNSSLPMSVKRLLMTADTIGGVWTYAVELAHALQEVEIALVTMGKPLNAEQRRQARELSNVEVYESNYKLEWMENPWVDIEKAGTWLLQIEREIRPNLVHLNNFTHGTLPWSIPHIIVGHSCVASWWHAVKKVPIPSGWSTYIEKVRNGLRRAACVVAPTRAMLNKFQELYGPLSSTRVIHNFRNPDLFRVHRKEEFIFAAGRLWDEAKNIALLAKAARDIPWPIVVAGEERHPICTGEKLPSSLNCLGRLSTSQLVDQLARASIYSAPALYEPFGLSILEAGLSGCALVLSDIPSLHELWHGAATFVSPHDPEAWQFELKQLIRFPSRRMEQAVLAQCRAIQFNPALAAREYLQLYETLLANQPTQERRSHENSNVLSHVAL